MKAFKIKVFHEEKQENRITLILKLLFTFMLASFPIWATATITPYKISEEMVLTYSTGEVHESAISRMLSYQPAIPLVVTLISVLFLYIFVFEKHIKNKMKQPVRYVGIVIGLIGYGAYIYTNFEQLENIWNYLLGANVVMSLSEYEQAVTTAIAVIMPLYTLFVMFVTWNKIRWILLVGMMSVITVFSWASEAMPWRDNLYIVLIYYIVLFAMNLKSAGKRKYGKEYRTYMQKVNNQVAWYQAAIMGIVFTVVVIGVVVVQPPKKYTPDKKMIQTELLWRQRVQEGSVKHLFNNYVVPEFTDTAAGGMSEGKLGEVKGIQYTYEQHLRVSVPRAVQGQGMYLKGFVGTQYHGTYWTQLKEDVSIENEESITYEILGNYNIPTRAIEIEVLGANPNYRYRPYYSNLSEEMSYYNGDTGYGYYDVTTREKTNAVYSYFNYTQAGRFSLSDNYKDLQDDYGIDSCEEFYEKSDELYDKYYGDSPDMYYEEEWEEIISATHDAATSYYLDEDLIDDYSMIEALVRELEYVESGELDNYLDAEGKAVKLDVELAQTSKEYNGELMIDQGNMVKSFYKKYGLQPYILFVQQFLKEHASYNMMPGKLEEGEDFVDDFLYNKKEGYCTAFASAGTLIFRNLGIPARYVEGYVLRKSDFKDNMTTRFLSPDYVRLGQALYCVDVYLTDENAHAWVEIYEEGVGWIPVEVTPGYENAVTTYTDDGQLETTTSEDSGNQQSTKKKTEKSTKADSKEDNADETKEESEAQKKMPTKTEKADNNKRLIVLIFSVLLVVYLVVAKGYLVSKKKSKKKSMKRKQWNNIFMKKWKKLRASLQEKMKAEQPLSTTKRTDLQKKCRKFEKRWNRCLHCIGISDVAVSDKKHVAQAVQEIVSNVEEERILGILCSMERCYYARESMKDEELSELQASMTIIFNQIVNHEKGIKRLFLTILTKI